MLTVGNLIKKLRIKAGLTQVELAKKIGIDDSFVRKHESGRGHAKPDTLEKYADALGVHPEALIGAELNSTKAMHHLFRIFNAYKGEFHTVKTSEIDVNGNVIEKETVAMSFDMLNEFIKEWKSEYEKTASSDTSEEAAYAYDYYIYNFPESSKTDQAYIDTLVEYDKKLTYTNLN